MSAARFVVVGVVLISVGTAQGRSEPVGGWRFEVSGPVAVTPSSSYAQIEFLAWFEHEPGVAELFGSGHTSWEASDGRWISFSCSSICAHPGPRFEGRFVRDLKAGQIHFPPNFGANPANPISIAAVEWTTSDFSPRTVSLRTTTVSFGVYRSLMSSVFVWAPPGNIVEAYAEVEVRPDCFPDCDSSTGIGVLDVFDFLCFQNIYAAGGNYACGCDTTTGPGVCDIFDFLCFQNAFAAGCP